MANEVQYLTIGSNTYSVGGLLVTINIITNGSTVLYTADKTAQEIYDAVSNGITPMIHEDSYYYPITTVRCHTNGIAFETLAGYLLQADSMSAYPAYTRSGGGGND